MTTPAGNPPAGDFIRGGRPLPVAPTAVAVIGPNTAGKTFLVNTALDDPVVADRVELVARVVTRPPRAEDGTTASVSREDFVALVERDELALSWERPLADGHSDFYGCRPPVDPSKVPIFIGGHGLYDNEPSVRPEGILDDILFIGVFADSETRTLRTAAREAAGVVVTSHRALPFDGDRLNLRTHYVIDNSIQFQKSAPAAFAAALEAALQLCANGQASS